MAIGAHSRAPKVAVVSLHGSAELADGLRAAWAHCEPATALHLVSLDLTGAAEQIAAALRALDADLLILAATGMPAENPLRAALLDCGVSHAVVHGPPTAQCLSAMASLTAWLRQRHPPPSPRTWRHLCARCGDAGCERHLFEHIQASPQHGPAMER